jgi:hypothetical protein
MPAIRHLLRLRGSARRRIGVGRCPIARDDFDPWVLLQPRFDVRTVTTLQDVDHTAPFQVDQNGAVVMAPSKREIVNPQASNDGLRLVVSVKVRTLLLVVSGEAGSGSHLPPAGGR